MLGEVDNRLRDVGPHLPTVAGDYTLSTLIASERISSHFFQPVFAENDLGANREFVCNLQVKLLAARVFGLNVITKSFAEAETLLEQ